MENRFSKFINLQGKYLTSLLIVLLFGVGQMWADVYLIGRYTLTNGALTGGSYGTYGAIKSTNGTTIAASTDVSYASNPTAAGLYYLKNNTIAESEITKVANWTTSGSSSTYFRGYKFLKNTSDTLNLGSLTATKIIIVGRFETKNANGVVTLKNSSNVSIGTIENNSSNGTTIKVNSFEGTYSGKIAISNSNHYDYRAAIYVITAAAPAKYWMAFDANGHGTAPDTIKNLAKDSVIPSAPTAPTASGWNFVEWNTKADGSGTAWNWGTTKVTQDTTLYAKWTSSAATQSNITYTNTKGADNSNPAKYYEGTGVASFEPLADVTDFHFTGWSPVSISTTATGDQTIDAQWVAAYDVTFSAGAGGGTIPASFQKWEGGKFNLPGQGSMTAPAGKVFDGWKANGAGDKLAADAEYTMGNAAVEFVAQWKAVPTTIYSLTVTNTSSVNLNNGGTQNDLSDDATIVGGGAYMQNDHASSAQQILGSTKLQFKAGTVTLVMTLNNALQEGDTIKATGLNSEGLSFGVTFDRAGNLTNQLASDASYFIVPEAFEGKTTLYAWRHSGSGTTCSSITIRRPAARDIALTSITLSGLKVNNHSISSDSLAALVANHSLTLGDEFAAAPEIKFTEHKVITYADSELPATKESDKVYTVTATTSGDNWQAQQQIGETTYTVTAPKVSSAKVYYYDGATKLGEEIVAINASPVNAGDYDDKNLASFVGWYNNSDLAEEHKIANIAELVVTEDTTVYGKWTYNYATSANIEQWVLEHGTNYGAVAQLGTLHYASNIANSLDTLNDDPSKTNRNYAYLGLKIKESGKMLDFRLANGQTVKVKFGATGNYPQVKINNVGSYAAMSLTDNVWTYTAEGADAYVSIKTNSSSTVVIKQIMINEELQAVTLPWRVTYNANGGTCATEEAIWKGAALVLPNVTPAEPADYTFAGWYDEISGGVLKGAAGASYNPIDNETLFAHFAPVEYAVAYDGNGATSGSMSASAAGWGTLVTPAVNAFEKTGNIFAGWVITKTSDGSATGITFSEGKFEMPKYDVTLVAQWEDVSKVAVVVETSAKYETLAAAIAAAEAGQTIQLLQNIEQENGVAIAKNLTLDLNGKTYTCTSGSNVNSRAIKITAGNVTIQNGSIIAVPTANFEGGCYGALRIDGATADVTCTNVTFINGRHYGLGIKLVNGNLSMEDCTVTSENGGGGLEVAGTATLVNCTFTQTGLDNAHKWISTCLAVCDNGVLNVQGGTYTSEHYSLYVYTSGGEMNVESGSFTGDVVNQVTLSSYPDAVGTINISGGSFEGVGEEPIHFTVDNSGATSIAISGGTFDAPVANEYCAPGYVPATISAGVYGVTPKDGVEIIGVVTTGGTNKTVTGLYKGDASVNLDSNKKLGSNKYIYVTLKDGYTFEESDVLVVDIATKSDIATKALEITTGIGNIDGEVWKTIAFDDYSTGENSISLAGIAANQTSIGLKRSANQNSYINGLKVYRPMKPMLTAITFNGETGAINEANKTVAITLPEATTDLAALTVVPTIVWNAAAAENSIVVNNGAAWQEGANTYKLTDKDGDATTYTITITLQGEAPAPVIATQPAANTAYCAGSEPTLSVTATGDELHYAWYKEAGETDEAVGDDAASYTIASAGTYYVIVTNHVDGKLDKSVTSENAVITLNVAAAITTQPSDLKKQIEGDNITLSVVASNATGYQWYSCEDKDKTNPVLIAGAESANYQFAAAAGFFYCEVTGACGAVESNVAEVTVKRSAGCQYITATSGLEATLADGLKMYAAESDGKQSTSGTSFATASSNAKGIDAGAVGSINKQYILVKFPVDVEEFTIYGYNSSTRSFNNLRVNDHIGTTNNDKFTSDMELTTEEVTKTNSKDGNEITMTAQLTRIIASDEYVWIKFNSALEIFRICYTEALAEPVLPTLGNQELCAGAAYVEMDATITNATACTGTVSYQWYNAANDEAIEGANAATFTPSAEGSYYVVVRHAAAGHVAREVKSANINVAHFDALAISSVSEDVFQHMGTATTLSVVATGKNVAYKWYTCDDAVGNGAVAIDPAQTEASLSIASILEGVHYYKVEVSHDCDATVLSRVIKVEGWNQLEQVDVTASIVWDMTNVSASEINLASFEPSKQNVRLLLANIEGVNNNASFNSQALMFEGQRIGRTENNVKYVSGQYVQFNVTVPGMVSVTFASNGSSQRTIQINGKVCSRTTNDGTYITYNVAVEPGSVEIEDVQGYVRISKIEFKAEDNYHRTVNPSYLGTLCWTNNAVLGGATLYEFAGKNENNYLVFDEVEENRLEAGKPYIFMPENGNTQIKVYNTDNEAALTEDQDPVNNMYGTITGKTLVPGVNDNMYYFSASHIWAVKDFNVNIPVPAYYCYVDYQAVLAGDPAPAAAPGRRRVTMGVQGEQVATGVEQIADDQLPVKVLINGQLFILRGEKMFNVNGQLVK